MTIDDLLKVFVDLFEDTDPSKITEETYFRELDEWSSLIGFAVLNVLSKKFGVDITPLEFKKVETIDELYKLIQDKQ